MPGMIFSVSELNAYVGGLLGADPHLRDLTVRGEISGFKRHSSGHLYFSLKDERALVRCVMFKGQAMQLDFRPEDGMQVCISGYAALYARDGSFQVYAQSMAREGAGALYARFLALKEQLEREGYFDTSHKKPIPFLPRCVGVVTSGTGAAIQDVLQIIGRRFPKMPICLCPVKVQGEGAAGEIAAGIRAMNRARTADVLIVGRGGGSIEDLWAFNEPEVARAIWESEIPVISAVGHETDFTIADFVADLRAPTPSAAAELAVPSYADCAETLAVLDGRLRRSLDAGLRSRRDRLHLLQNSAGFHMAAQRVSDGRFELDALRERLCRGAERTLLAKRQRLERLHGALAALNPDAVLQRGYAMICDEAGHVLSSVADVQLQEQIAVRLSDGRLTATVNNIEKKEP
ncbi:MAG: exodeoxyribonuclease VII large subunit [bacterium]|nr:exodeoxyribonuclease VII large subunit [bacterium]